MKDTDMRDERVVAERRKIQSDGFQILFWVLIISAFVQQVVFHAPPAQFAVEFFCWVGCGVYIIIRHLASGIDIWNTKGKSRKKVITSVLISTILSALLLRFLNGEGTIESVMIFVITFITASFLTYTLIQFVNKKKQAEITSKLDEDEMDE